MRFSIWHTRSRSKVKVIGHSSQSYMRKDIAKVVGATSSEGFVAATALKLIPFSGVAAWRSGNGVRRIN